jgi:hypothetical protein
MTRKGFRRVTREQSRQATIRNLRHLRDIGVQYAKDTLARDDWRVALECLLRAAHYEQRAEAMERGKVV